MYIQLQADTQEIIDEAKPMICFFCVPKDTQNVRANIRGLITQLFKARNYEGPGRYKYTANSLADIEVCFMSEECFKGLIENTEEIALGIKNLVALLGEDKTIYHRWPKPALPTTETPNPTLTVDRDSVFQATRYLDPLALIGQKFTIADIMATATTDAVVSLDPIGQTTLALEAKADKANENLDKIRVEVEKIDPRLETTNTYLEYLYKAFYAGFDIMPLVDQSFFVLMRNALFSTGFFVDESHLKKHNQLLENGLFQSTTINYSNSWLAKLGDISNISGWLTADDGRLKLFFENVTQIKNYLDYHLGEVQFGIKYFFNVFAKMTDISGFGDYSHLIKFSWPKPNNSGQDLELRQQSVLQNNPDGLDRGFNFYDWLVMWVKPHGENWQGNGYVNPSTNLKGHELVNLTGDISNKLDDIASPIDTFVGYFGLTGKFGAWWSGFLTWWTSFIEWWTVFSIWFQAEFIAGFTAIVASIVGLAIKQGVSLVGGWLDYWLGFIGVGEGEPIPPPDTTLSDIKTILGNMRTDTQAIATNSDTKLTAIKDTLFSGLMFSGSLSMMSLINNSLQSIWGVLRVDMNGINTSLSEIAAKDCCNTSTTTVTNPDGSTTTTPNPRDYPLVDPSIPYDPITNPNTGSYNTPTLQQPTDNRHDEICGYTWRTLDLFVGFFQQLNSQLVSDSTLAVVGVNRWAEEIKLFPKPIHGVWLAKLSLAELRNLGSKFNACAYSTNFSNIDEYVADNMEDVACFEYGDTITNQQILNRLSAELVADNVTPPFIDYILYTLGLWYRYGLFQPDNLGSIAISNWSQFCPCQETPTGITGQWNLSTGSPNPYTLTQTGNAVSFTNANGTVTGQGTFNGLVLSGTWANSSNGTSGTFVWTFNQAITSFTGTGTNTDNVTFGWNGNKVL